jgi:poly-gamma-glutamate synthesis protein (capsule biosynthesis protein)
MKLIFLGDYCVSNARQPKISAALAARMKLADIMCVNFEGPMVTPAMQAAPKTGPVIHQTAQAVSWLHEMGASHACLANNHNMDYGADGLQQTRDALSAADVTSFGAGGDFKTAYSPCMVDAQGKKLAFLAFGEGQFGVLNDTEAGAAGFAWVGHSRARQAVAQARRTADHVIVQVHAGLEMAEIPLPEWRRCYHELIDLGADIVIGHHPHVTQGQETFGKGQIFYSLGNFYMDVMLAAAVPGHGAMVEVTLDKQGLSAELVPLSVRDHEVDIDLSPEAIAAQQKRDDILGDMPTYQRAVEQLVETAWRDIYENYYAAALLGIGTGVSWRAPIDLLKNWARGLVKGRRGRLSRDLLLLHNIRIETHRWVVERALQNKI